MTTSTHDVVFQSACDLANHMKKRVLSPIEVVEAYFEQIHFLNPVLNAYVNILWDDAMDAARACEARILRNEGRCLEGVPIAIKDNMSVKGVPTMNGSRMYKETPSSKDGHLVRCLRDAGAIILGKTNLPEFATLPVTVNDRFGTTRNPWNLDYTPGGSSGGSAVAVASGMAPVAHGNDGGGSLRIPGSACGLFTMKPSRGRISYAPWLGDALSGLAVQGFLTRTVADNAILLDVTSGFVPGDPYTTPTLQKPYSQEILQPVRPLRIGWTVTPVFQTIVHPVCIQAVQDTVALLKSLGHQVEECTPHGWNDPDLWDLFMNVWAAGISWGIQMDIAQGLSVDDVEFHNHALWNAGKELSAADYLVTITKLQQYSRLIMSAFHDYDVLLTPTLGEPPVKIGEMFAFAHGDANMLMKRGGQFNPFASVANVTGQPAMQVPCLWEDGLPIGVQLIGRQYDETTLFQLAMQLESEKPWAHIRPPIC